MKRLTVLALALACIATVACTRERVHVIPRSQLPNDLFPGGRSEPEGARLVRVDLYFVRDGQLQRVQRTGRSRRPQHELILGALLAGPTEAEEKDGISSAITPAVEPLGVSIEDGVAEVNLSSQFSEGVSREDFVMRLAQVVYSLTELGNIDSVRFLAEGERVTVFDQSGREIDGPVARGRYTRFAPDAPLEDAVPEGDLLVDVQGPEETAEPR